MMKSAVITNIEQIYDTITYQCQEYLFYPPNNYKLTTEKIQNAASMLFFDAMIIFNNELEYGKKSNLSLAQITELLKNIRDILSEPDMLIEKEDKIRAMLKEYNLDPKKFLKNNEWDGNFIDKAES